MLATTTCSQLHHESVPNSCQQTSLSGSIVRMGESKFHRSENAPRAIFPICCSHEEPCPDHWIDFPRKYFTEILWVQFPTSILCWPRIIKIKEDARIPDLRITFPSLWNTFRYQTIYCLVENKVSNPTTVFDFRFSHICVSPDTSNEWVTTGSQTWLFGWHINHWQGFGLIPHQKLNNSNDAGFPQIFSLAFLINT